MTEMSPLRLCHGATTIGVHASDAAVLTWLAEFLAPAFSQDHRLPGMNDPLVVFEVDREAHRAAAHAQPPEPVPARDGFTFDGGFSQHPVWTDADGWEWAHDRECDTCYGVHPGRRHFRVVVPQATRPARLALMRVVREIATDGWLRAGALPLHAGAFRCGGLVVLACGPKRSGKTSLLVHALRSGSEFVANDRVFVAPGGSRTEPSGRPLSLHGMATIVAIREGTLSLFPALKDRVERARFHWARTVAECAPGVQRPAPWSAPGADRPGMSQTQFCALLEAPMTAGGAPGLLLFPRVDPAAQGIEIERLPFAEAEARLRDSLLRPATPISGSDIFRLDRRRAILSGDEERDKCRALLDAVPACECRLGPGAYATDIKALLDDVYARS